MTGARPFQLRFKLVADNTIEGGIGHLQAQLLPEPGLDCHIAGEARSGRQPRLELGEGGGGSVFCPDGAPGSL